MISCPYDQKIILCGSRNNGKFLFFFKYGKLWEKNHDAFHMTFIKTSHPPSDLSQKGHDFHKSFKNTRT